MSAGDDRAGERRGQVTRWRTGRSPEKGDKGVGGAEGAKEVRSSREDDGCERSKKKSDAGETPFAEASDFQKMRFEG